MSPAAPARDASPRRRRPSVAAILPRREMLTLIGLFKLAKGILVVTIALELLRLDQNGLAAALARWATRVHVDPDGRYLSRAVRAITALDRPQLEAVRAGLFVYGALCLTEGVGLLRRKRWGEYFTIMVTASFIPLELYEIARRPDAIRIAVCLVNVAIVWYLARGLRRRE